MDKDSIPLSGIRITLTGEALAGDVTLHTDAQGLFLCNGLQNGCYNLQIEAQDFQSLLGQAVCLEASQNANLKVYLSASGHEEPSRMDFLPLDYTQNLHQTNLEEAQIHGLPFAHNVWTLVENQDLSATANRIDVGGLWSGIPALFSARGGTSWTQTVYQLNGMEVTDPYTTGRPLFYPDFYSLQSTQLINAGHPPEALSPGGYFNLMTREGEDRFHGGVSAYYTSHSLQSSNIAPELEAEGINESHGFNYHLDGNIHLSGPIIPRKLTFFSSLSAFDISRNLAEYEPEDKSELLSGLFALKYRLGSSNLRLIWTGQKLSHLSYGADREVPFSSTSDRKETFQVLQGIWESRIQNRHYFQLGLNYVQGNIQSDFQEGFSAPFGMDIFTKNPMGLAPLAFEDERQSLTFRFKGESVFGRFLAATHRLQYGFQIQQSSSSSQKDIWDNLHLHFYENNPLEVVFYEESIQHSEKGLHYSLFVQDSLTFANFLSFFVGFNLTSSRGRGDNGEIQWLNLSPRFGLSIPLSRSKLAVLKLSVGRYYYSLPLYFMTYGAPQSLGGLVYEWLDHNQDHQFQDGEIGNLLRREGPQYSEIDPDIKRPYTDELAISYSSAFGSGWFFSLGGFHRNTKNLVHALNIGVPLSAYDPQYVIDSGDDRIPNTPDDQIYTVFNQRPDSLGQDFFLLTNVEPDKRNTVYFGLDLNLVKKFGERFSFFLSLTATQAEGQTNPGNTEFENDDGVVGDLFANPNALINAKGRVRFDRAYTGRIGLNYLAPWDIRLGCVIKYYDGQPFARKLIIEGFNQGPFYIQANPRGVSRYEYNRTVDIRVEKIWRLGQSKLRIIADGFNILNRGLATEENEWTRPEYPQRYATEIQSPRVIRLGMALEF